jgi:hypothetical protein
LLRFELEHRNLLRIWEPLRTNASGLARPYCCYINSVIFYNANCAEIDRVEYRFVPGCFGGHTLIFWRGSWWEIGSGEIKFVDDRWWVIHRLWRNNRVPMRLNGEEAWLGKRAIFPWWWRIVRPVLDRLRDARLIDGRPPMGFDIPPSGEWIFRWYCGDDLKSGPDLFCWVDRSATYHLKLRPDGVPAPTWWVELHNQKGGA